MKDPKVLIYIPCHNYLEFAKECMDSAVNQTYPNQEIIVSFNGCTDGVDRFVKENYPQVKSINYPIYNSEANPGVNTAIGMSDCDIYIQLMMDDRLEPNFWEQVLPYFTSDDIGFVRISCYQFSKEHPEGSLWRPFSLKTPLEILMSNSVFVFSPTRKVVWESINGIATDLPIFGDWDFWIRAILHGWKWTTYAQPLYWLRRHSESESSTYDQAPEGIVYANMRAKWAPTLKKYNIKNSILSAWT